MVWTANSSLLVTIISLAVAFASLGIDILMVILYIKNTKIINKQQTTLNLIAKDNDEILTYLNSKNNNNETLVMRMKEIDRRTS